MNSKKNKKEELRNLSILLIFMILLVPLAILAFNKDSNNKVEQNSKDANDHNIITYTSDNNISIYNTKSGKYTSSISLSKGNTIQSKKHFENPFTLIPSTDNSVFISSPTTNEIISYEIQNGEFKEKIKIKTQFSPNKIALDGINLVISYIDSKQIDLLNLDTQKIEKTFTLKDSVDTVLIDDKQIYVANGDNIEIIPLSEEDKRYTIFTGAKTLSLYKSNDGFLYAGNIFASDSKNSLLIKIDLQNKNIKNILELKKEFPISIIEYNNDLLVLCKGLEDKTMDGISVVNKSRLTNKTNISTGNSPNSISIADNKIAYIAHDNGEVISIDLSDEYKKSSAFTTSGVKSIYALPIK